MGAGSGIVKLLLNCVKMVMLLGIFQLSRIIIITIFEYNYYSTELPKSCVQMVMVRMLMIMSMMMMIMMMIMMMKMMMMMMMIMMKMMMMMISTFMPLHC